MGQSELTLYLNNFDPHVVNLLSLDFGSLRSLMCDPSIPKGRKVTKVLEAFDESNQNNLLEIITYLFNATKGGAISAKTYSHLLDLHDAVCYFTNIKPFIHHGDYIVLDYEIFDELPWGNFIKSERQVFPNCQYHQRPSLAYNLAEFNLQYNEARWLKEFIELAFEGTGVKPSYDSFRHIFHNKDIYNPTLSFVYHNKPYCHADYGTIWKKAEKLALDLYSVLEKTATKYSAMPLIHLNFNVDTHSSEFVYSKNYERSGRNNRSNAFDVLRDENHHYHDLIIKSPLYKELEDSFFDHFYMFHTVKRRSYFRPVKRNSYETSDLNWNNKVRRRTFYSDEILFEIEEAGNQQRKILSKNPYFNQGV